MALDLALHAAPALHIIPTLTANITIAGYECNASTTASPFFDATISSTSATLTPFAAAAAAAACTAVDHVAHGVTAPTERPSSTSPITTHAARSMMQTPLPLHPLMPLQRFVDALNDTSLHSLTYNEWNTTYHDHQHFLNETAHRSDCKSIHMPISYLISMLLYGIVCVVGLLGNTLVIYVVIRFSKMQTVTNMYILNLAIADECFLIGIPFLISTMYVGHWNLGKWVCKAYMVSTSVTQFTSSLFLLIMSADRYVAVCHPISSTRYRSPLVSQVVSLWAWVTSALMMLPVMMYAGTFEKDTGRGEMTCNIDWPNVHDGSGFTFTLYSLCFGFAIPLSLILIFYYLVLRKLRTVGPKSRTKEKRRSHRKVTKLVLTVITVYILCWMPHWVSQVALINSPPNDCQTRLEVMVFVLVGCLGYSNSAMNPILYAFLSDNFKKSFMKACSCATGKDAHTQLQMENSLLQRFGKRGSDKAAASNRAVKASDAQKASNEMNAAGDNTSESAQTKSTGNSTYKSGGKLDTVASNDRPPVLHTDL